MDTPMNLEWMVALLVDSLETTHTNLQTAGDVQHSRNVYEKSINSNLKHA